MTHLPPLISDLALILFTAAVVTVLFQKLKQPLVLGYLLAGVLVGNSFSFFPNVSDPHSIQIWAEIGVIFLLFGLGLEFSYSKLAQYGRSAGITAPIEVFFMLGLGFLTGKALGWRNSDSLFLGGIIAISSTSIIVRAFEEMKLKSKGFAQFVLGVLVFEDLLAILILVAFSAIGASRGALTGGNWDWLAVIPTLGFFLILTFTLGMYIIPELMKRWKKELSDETVLIFSLGLCLAMVVFATKSGFSPALGAFLMGSIIGGTGEAHRIEKLLFPIKDLFAAVFFVSVGMLIDPRILVDYAGSIAVIVVVIILGKTFAATIGSLLSGQSARDSIRTGLSLAQIGEFSFIIATLGMTMKITSNFLYPITVAVAVLTTFTTPYLIRWSSPIATWIEAKLGEGFRDRIDSYRQAVNTTSSSNLRTLILHAIGLAPLVNSVIVIATTLAVKLWLVPRFGEALSPQVRSYVFSILTLILVSPFLFGILQSKVRTDSEDETQNMRAIFFGVLLARAFVTLALVFFVFGTFSSDSVASLVLIILVFTSLYFGRRWLEPAYRRFETRFMTHLQDDLNRPRNSAPQHPKPKFHLTPWDAKLIKVTVTADSGLATKTLFDANLRDHYGVMVALIGRGSRQIMTPGRDEQLLPGDVLYLIGNEEQIENARADLEFQSPEPFEDQNIGLSPLKLDPNSKFLNKSIRDSGLRESTQGLIVGLERDGDRILNPDSGLQLAEGDLLWIVGRYDLIKSLGTI